MEAIARDLRTILAELSVVARREPTNKRELSRALAKSFMDSLESEGAKILDTTTGSANYFCAEIGGVPVAISPFGSHEGFWEKLSAGFRDLKEKRGCRWGVVLFVLPEKRGLWIEGDDYDTYVLQERKKVHLIEVARAEKSEKAHSFHDSKEFLDLITKGPRLRARTMLVKKRRPSTSKGEL